MATFWRKLKWAAIGEEALGFVAGLAYWLFLALLVWGTHKVAVGTDYPSFDPAESALEFVSNVTLPSHMMFIMVSPFVLLMITTILYVFFKRFTFARKILNWLFARFWAQVARQAYHALSLLVATSVVALLITTYFTATLILTLMLLALLFVLLVVFVG